MSLSALSKVAARFSTSSIRPLQSSRVAIIGGSIGACAAATALERAGLQDITVFERSPARHSLAHRGLGIGLPIPIFEQLVEHDMVDATMRCVETKQRHWIVKNKDDHNGRVLYSPELNMQIHNWDLLWQQLRKRVPNSQYRSGVSVDLKRTKIHASTVELFQAGGSSVGEYDFVIQANGALAGCSDTKANYAGYGLWRSSFHINKYPEIDPKDLLQETLSTVVFPDGHAIFSLIPSPTATDDYLLNFAVYTQTPPGLEGEHLYKVTRCDLITPEQLEFFEAKALSHMPTRFQDMINVCIERKNMTFHPILDRVPSSFIVMNGMGLLLGDAGAVLRPHTGCGTTKAVTEAFLLEELVKSKSSWNDVAQAYQESRQEDAAEKVALGQRLGRAQVLHAAIGF